jgi:uncharacterized OB-fold protein
MNTTATEKPKPLPAKPLPDRTDPDNAPFWEATDRGVLLVKLCADCSKYHWPPRVGCPHCGSGKVDWTETAPRGTIFSWTIVHRSQTPGFGGEVPYAVLLVELNEAPGVRMIGNLVGAGIEAVEAGRAVEGVFTPAPDGSATLVNWKPA